MNRCRFLACALLLGTSVFAQDDLTRPQKIRAVTMAPAAPVTLSVAKPAWVVLQFRVSPGYHVNSNKPNSEYLIPTVLKLDAQTGLLISKTTYPKGENLTFPFAPNEKLNVYTGDFAISARVSAAQGTPIGRYRIHGRLTTQACDNKACYPPRDLPVAFDVHVKKSTTPRSSSRPRPGQSPHVR